MNGVIKLLGYLSVLTFFIGALGLIAFCVLATNTPGPDGYGEAAVGCFFAAWIGLVAFAAALESL